MALRADWRRQLRRVHDELGFRHVRFHGLLSSDQHVVIRENGGFRYSFFTSDQIFDYLQSIGMRPFVELSFMPAALASGNKTVFSYEANVTPPRDYTEWATLIQRVVGHCVERYGPKEVGKWLFEVWNEPNLNAFWTGTQRDYFKLYRYTAEAIKGVGASLQVGGPATAMSEWIEEFVDFCERNDVPADFISTHHYPNDGYEGDGDTEIALFKSQRGTLREAAQNTRLYAGSRPVYYTEWNSSSDPSDPLHDEPYAAAFVASTVMEANGLVEGYSFWTFSDIFEERMFPTVPFHGGFGLLNLQGVPKPTYRAFELLHQLGDRQSLVDGLHETVDCNVIQKESSLSVVLTNHTTPGHSIETEDIQVRLDNAAEPLGARIQRIDRDHANPKRLWQEMGQPLNLTEKQVAQLDDASHVVTEKQLVSYDNGSVFFKVRLPSHAIAVITLDFKSHPRKATE